jgi:hypothetical protein
MDDKLTALRILNDKTLIERVARLAERGRLVTAELVLYLAELKRREAYRELGFGSLWSYVRERLGMAEAGAGRRIKAAKVVLLAPEAYELLREKLHGAKNRGGEEGARALRSGVRRKPRRPPLSLKPSSTGEADGDR